MLAWLKRLLGIEDKLFGARRDPRWTKLRNEFFKKNPKCFCGKPGDSVHHKIPVHIDKSKELLVENLTTLCSDHRLFYGHLGSFFSFNDELDKWIAKVKNRPTKKDVDSTES